MLFTTTIKAIDPKTGELHTWQGPNIEGISFAHAQDWCNNNGLGYCKVDGLLQWTEDMEGNKTEFIFWN